PLRVRQVCPQLSAVDGNSSATSAASASRAGTWTNSPSGRRRRRGGWRVCAVERYRDIGFAAADRYGARQRCGGQHGLGHVQPDFDVYALAFLYGESGSAIGFGHARLVPKRQRLTARTFGIVLEVKLSGPKVEDREERRAARDGDRQSIVLLER